MSSRADTAASASNPQSMPLASIDRIVDIAVGIRPFRAHGPRLQVQRLQGKKIRGAVKAGRGKVRMD